MAGLWWQVAGTCAQIASICDQTASTCAQTTGICAQMASTCAQNVRNLVQGGAGCRCVVAHFRVITGACSGIHGISGAVHAGLRLRTTFSDI